MRFKGKTRLREGFLGWGGLNRFVSRKKNLIDEEIEGKRKWELNKFLKR